MKRRACVAALGAALWSCAAPVPVRIGYLSGIPERHRPRNQAARNGLILAAELCNQAGGLLGQPVELLLPQADGRSVEEGLAAARRLIEAGVAAIVGPHSSVLVTAVLPLIDAARTVIISPTATGQALVGLDDQLVRLAASTLDYTRGYARRLWTLGQRRVSVAYDDAVVSDSWRLEFRATFEALGGRVLHEARFRPDEKQNHGALALALLAPQPDGLVCIGDGDEVALIAQQVRKQGSMVPLAAAERAFGATLLALGGQAVEGLVMARNFDADDPSPRYQRFTQDYLRRFGLPPLDTSVSTYDAASVLLDALRRPADGRSLKQRILRGSPYQGLQQTIAFDRFGDARHELHFVQVRDGRFVALP